MLLFAKPLEEKKGKISIEEMQKFCSRYDVDIYKQEGFGYTFGLSDREAALQSITRYFSLFRVDRMNNGNSDKVKLTLDYVYREENSGELNQYGQHIGNKHPPKRVTLEGKLPEEK